MAQVPDAAHRPARTEPHVTDDATNARARANQRRTSVKAARSYIAEIRDKGAWADVAIETLQEWEELLAKLVVAEVPVPPDLRVGMEVVILDRHSQSRPRFTRTIKTIGRKWVYFTDGSRMPIDRGPQYTLDSQTYLLSMEEEVYYENGRRVESLMRDLVGYSNGNIMGMSLRKKNRILVFLEAALKET